MKDDGRTITFRERDFKGSRLRCLLATHIPRPKVSEFLSSLAQPHATVSATDRYAPSGFLQPDEAKLGETPGFLCAGDREAITDWWLAVRRGANTPNWDIASTCMIGNRKGLLLVEAKAHAEELLPGECCGAKNKANRDRIHGAIAEAEGRLNAVTDPLGWRWRLSPDSHYQLSNRFAWTWKLAAIGVPVVLVYLGFLNAADELGTPFADYDQWRACLLEYSKGRVPERAWGTTVQVNGTPFTALIRSADVKIVAGGAGVRA